MSEGFMTIPAEEPKAKEKELSVRLSESRYVSSAVDSSEVSFDSLSTYVPGAKWRVQYYQLMLSRDDAAKHYEAGAVHSTQQYHLIKDLYLRVTEPITTNQTGSNQNQFEATGAAVINGSVIPNIGDVFVADLGGARSVQLSVTEVKQMSIYQETAYNINYTVVWMMNKDRQELLDSYVVKRSVFDERNLRNGLVSIVSEEHAKIKQELFEIQYDLTNMYLDRHFSNTFRTLIVPSQEKPTYDPFLIRFLKRIIDSDEFPKIVDVRVLGVDAHPNANVKSLFDSIINGSERTLRTQMKYATLIDSSRFKQASYYDNISRTGIKRVVVGADVPYSEWRRKIDPVGEIKKGGVYRTDGEFIIPELDMNAPPRMPVEESPYIHRVVYDDFYVLSEAFYLDKPGKSKLEHMLLERMKGTGISLKELSNLAEMAYEFDNLESFYYIPLILSLINSADGVI